MFMRRYIVRLNHLQWMLIGTIGVNLIVLYSFAVSSHNMSERRKNGLLGFTGNWQNSLTVIFNEFEDFDNHVSHVVRYTRKILPGSPILIVSDDIIYPPLNITRSDLIKQISLKVLPEKSSSDLRPDSYIKTNYVMFVPDAIEILNAKVVRDMITYFNQQPKEVKMVVWAATAMREVTCLSLDANFRQWKLKYRNAGNLCDAVEGKFVMLTRSETLLKLPQPFRRPFQDAFFMQTAVRGWKVAYYKHLTFRKSKELFQDPHLNWKHKTKQYSRLKSLYQEFGVKEVEYNDG